MLWPLVSQPTSPPIAHHCEDLGGGPQQAAGEHGKGQLEPQDKQASSWQYC